MSLETRLRRELQAEEARLAPPPGDLDRVVRRGRRKKMAAAVGNVLLILALTGVTALLVRSVGRERPVTEEEPAPTVTTLSTTPTATTAPGPSTTPTTKPVTTTMPQAALSSGNLIVAGQEGISVVRDGQTEVVYDLATRLALDDLRGGVVFQLQVSSPTTILWLPAGATQPEELAVPGGTETLQLHDVAIIEGSPTVVYTRRSGTTPEDTTEELFVHDLATGQSRQVVRVGGWESGPSQVSYGGGRFLVSRLAEAETSFQFLSEAGEPLEVPGNPRPEPQQSPVFAGSLSPDGSSMAYLAQEEAGGASALLVSDLAAGEQAASFPLAEAPPLGRTDFDGRLAVASLQDGRQFANFLLDLAGNSLDKLQVSGLPTLLMSEVGAVGSPDEELPGPVAETRREIMEAAAAGDVQRLVELALAGRDSFSYSFGGSNPPSPDELREAWVTLPPLVEVLQLPHGTLESEEIIYVWPSAAAGNPTEEDWAALSGLYSEEEIAQMRQFGGYIGFRVGITEDGDWIFAVAGD